MKSAANLKTLEYRDYGSAGLAVRNQRDNLVRARVKRWVSRLKARVAEQGIMFCTGVGSGLPSMLA